MSEVTLPEQLQAQTQAAFQVGEVRRQHHQMNGGCPAVWDKLYRVGQYLEDEQKKTLSEIFRDPEAPRPGRMIEITTPLPAQSWLDRILSWLDGVRY